MQKETKFSQKISSRLATQKPWIWYFKTQMLALLGIPDYIICANGKFIAWELKVGHNKATTLQRFILDKIEAAGGIARVVTPENYEECYQEVLQCLEN